MTAAKIIARPRKWVIRVVAPTNGVKTVRVSRMGVRGPAGTNHPAQIVISIVGPLPAAPNHIFQYFTASEDMTIQLADIRASSEAAATGTYVLSVIRTSDSVIVATFTWSAGQTVPIVAVPVPGWLTGQKFKWQGETTPDATLRDISINMPAIR